MKPARHGERWAATEQDSLLSELRGEIDIAEIAAIHQRSVAAIRLQVERLVDGPPELGETVSVFEWARSELRKGRDGLPARVVEQTHTAVTEKPSPPQPSAAVSAPREGPPTRTPGRWSREVGAHDANASTGTRS